MYKHFLKRGLDFILVLCVLAVIWPILLVITVWLHFANKGAGAFFTQERPGKGGKIFKVIKFKSMTDERDNNGDLLPNEQRITKVGEFIRKTSIDELPQLINIFIGKMSVVGPRPPLPKEVAEYTDYQKQRLAVKGGLLCLWQIQHDRNKLSFDDWVRLDLEYIQNRSLWLDFKIIVKGFFMVVFDRSGE